MMRELSIHELDNIFEILRQDGVRGYNGQFASSESTWFMHFFDSKETSCFTFGWYEEERLVGVLIAESLTDNGCMIWYIAVRPEDQGKGYGSKLLSSFEEYSKSIGIKWIYLVASKNSLEFYRKNDYITSEYSNVFEHVKNFE